jgi:hypothetical protein
MTIVVCHHEPILWKNNKITYELETQNKLSKLCLLKAKLTLTMWYSALGLCVEHEVKSREWCIPE